MKNPAKITWKTIFNPPPRIKSHYHSFPLFSKPEKTIIECECGQRFIRFHGQWVSTYKDKA